jgi:catechol 2,3-dioxygenase-like lactoylglutathione lyase family enzyme
MLQDAPMYAYLPARDLTRARKFYEGKLSFKPGLETNGGVVYEFGKGTAAFLYLTENAGTSKASQAFWSVADVDLVIVALRAKGVVFEEYPEMPGERSAQGAVTAGGAKAAWFRDSEGNILALIEEVAGG